jgi:hypothetical protein
MIEHRTIALTAEFDTVIMLIVLTKFFCTNGKVEGGPAGGQNQAAFAWLAKLAVADQSLCLAANPTASCSGPRCWTGRRTGTLRIAAGSSTGAIRAQRVRKHRLLRKRHNPLRRIVLLTAPQAEASCAAL